MFDFDLEVSDLGIELDICATFLINSSLNIEIFLLISHLKSLQLI